MGAFVGGTMNRRTLSILVITLTFGLASFALAQDDAEGGGGDDGAGGAESAAPLEVTEIQMGTELEGGVPTSPSTSFSRTERSIYCMVRLRNRTGEAGNIRIAFERAGEGEPGAGPRGRMLEYPARGRYRTVARGTPNRSPGSYRCVVRTEEGEVLSHQDFTITE